MADPPACAGAGSLALTIGQECVVRLPANPSTGYQWMPQPAEPATRAPVVQQVGAGEYVAAEVGAAAPRVGLGGEMVFRLRAVAVGEVTLRWDYRRTWEPPETPAAQVHTLTLRVR